MSIRPFMFSSGLALAAAASFVARPAVACTCATNTLISPPDNSADVPVNAVVVFESPTAPVVYDETHSVAVAITAEPFGEVARTWIVHPNAPWAPNSTFKVTDPSFAGAAGSHFSTSAITDDVAPIYDGISSLRVDATPLGPTPPCRSSCWINDTLRRVQIEYAPPPADSSLLLLEIRRGGTSVTGTIPIYRYSSSVDWRKRFEAGSCLLGMPPFGPGEEVCARLVAFDVAGHRSAPSPEICSSAISCALEFDQTCSLPAVCSPQPEPSGMNDAGRDAVEPDATPIDATTDVIRADVTAADTLPPPSPVPDAEPADAPTVITRPDTSDVPPPPPPVPDAGVPGTPPDNGGCSVSRHHAPSSSSPPLFAVWLVAASFLLRRRRSVSSR